MKRKLKRLLSFLICMIVAIFSSVSSFADNHYWEFKNTDLSEEIAIEQFENLMKEIYNSSEESNYFSISSDFNNKNYDKIEYLLYPDDYAGACYNADGTGKLDIYIVNGKFSNYTGFVDKSKINFHNAKYSLNDMLETQTILYLNYNELYIMECSIIQKDNKIEVKVLDNHLQDFYSKLKKLPIDPDMLTVSTYKTNDIEIKDNNTITTKYNDINSTNSLHKAYAGKITGCTTAGSCTVGFNAYDYVNHRYGIVTAGHLVYNKLPYLTVYGGQQSYILTVVADTTMNYYDGGVCDAVFVPFSNEAAWASTTQYKNALDSTDYGNINSYTYPATQLEGTTTYKYGITSGGNVGSLVSVYCFILHSDTGICLHDMIKTSNYNSESDSGGPIGIRTGSSSPYSFSIMGITSCKDDENYTYGTKITNLFSGIYVNIY